MNLSTMKGQPKLKKRLLSRLRWFKEPLFCRQGLVEKLRETEEAQRVLQKDCETYKKVLAETVRGDSCFRFMV